MPNPAWTLSDAEASVFVAKLSTLIETEAQPRFNNLGYRGLIARIQQGDHREVRLQDGLVEVRGRISTFLSDPDRALERWLLATGRRFVDEEVFKIIAVEVERRGR
jgi:hypothetical protein